MPLLPVKDINFPEYPRKAEFVLIFKVRSIAPLENQYLYVVFPDFYIGGNINLACTVGNLTV